MKYLNFYDYFFLSVHSSILFAKLAQHIITKHASCYHNNITLGGVAMVTSSDVSVADKNRDTHWVWYMGIIHKEKRCLCFIFLKKRQVCFFLFTIKIYNWDDIIKLC